LLPLKFTKNTCLNPNISCPLPEIKKVNPEKLATEDTQDEEKQKHKQQLEVKTKPTYKLIL
jgi:hypothetical protein